MADERLGAPARGAGLAGAALPGVAAPGAAVPHLPAAHRAFARGPRVRRIRAGARRHTGAVCARALAQPVLSTRLRRAVPLRRAPRALPAGRRKV